MQQDITISTFYKFVPLADTAQLRAPIREAMQQRGIRGTITLAPEGLNATVSGPDEQVEELIAHLSSYPQIGLIAHKESHTSAQPFARTKVKLKKELISLGEPANPSVCVGEYVPSSQWNVLITQPDVITIDTRNEYEYRVGHFEGAINPATRTFKETVAFTKAHLNPVTHPRVAMYCTGGIRCEKYSSYLLTLGFQQVYHLQGGILQYLADIPETQSLWRGACYVFDERVAVNHDLSKAVHITMCGPCGAPLLPSDRDSAHYHEGTRCPYCPAR